MEYSITHSVALSEIPSFHESHSIERGIMYVCALSVMCAAILTLRQIAKFKKTCRFRLSRRDGLHTLEKTRAHKPTNFPGRCARTADGRANLLESTRLSTILTVL